MPDTLKHPAVSPTTTITFDGIIDVNHGRQAVNSEDFGSTIGVSKQAASNRTKGQAQVSIVLATLATGDSVRTKVKNLMTLFKLQAEDDMEILLNFADGGTLTWVGKVIAVNGTFQGGTAAVKWIGTIQQNVATETWS